MDKVTCADCKKEQYVQENIAKKRIEKFGCFKCFECSGEYQAYKDFMKAKELRRVQENKEFREAVKINKEQINSQDKLDNTVIIPQGVIGQASSTSTAVEAAFNEQKRVPGTNIPEERDDTGKTLPLIQPHLNSNPLDIINKDLKEEQK